MEEFIAVGKVVSPHGIKGEVRVVLLTDYPERFSKGSRVYATLEEKRKPLVVEGSRQIKDALLVKFEGIDTRDQAAEVGKSLLEIKEEELKKLPPGTYWQHEVIGLKVYTVAGTFLGEVTGIMETGERDVYVVGSGEKEVLIPATKEVVKEVRLNEGKMIIQPLPGLLE